MSTVNLGVRAPQFHVFERQLANMPKGAKLAGVEDLPGFTRVFVRPEKRTLTQRLLDRLYGNAKAAKHVKHQLAPALALAAGNLDVADHAAQIHAELRRGKHGHRLRADVLQWHFSAIARHIEQDAHLQVAQQAEERGLVQTPRLEMLAGHLDLSGITKEMHLAGLTRSKSDLAAVLASRLRQALNQRKDLAFSFAVSSCDEFKRQLVDYLEQSAPATLDRDFIYESVDRAMRRALQSVRNDDEERDMSTPLGTVENVKAVTLGNQEFIQREENGRIHDGGMGTIGIYEAPGHPPIVSKWSKSDGSFKERFDATAAEALAHYAAAEGSAPYVVPFRGAIRLPGGDLAIAMDYASHGDVGKLGARLHAADPDHDDPDIELVRLTAAKDMADAFANIHGKGISHLDGKGQNFLIGADGRCRLTDFGTSQLTDKPVLRSGGRGGVSQMRWRDPKFGQAMYEVNGALKEVQAKFKKPTQWAREDRKALAKAGMEKDAHARAKDLELLQEKFELEKGALQVEFMGPPADVWSWAATVYEMEVGHPPFDHDTGFSSEIEDEQLRFNQATPDEQRAMLFEGTPVKPALQDLLLQAMHPDPAQRPTAAEIAESPVLNAPGVGSVQARDRLIDATRPPTVA